MPLKILAACICLLTLNGCVENVVNSNIYPSTGLKVGNYSAGVAYALPRALIPLVVKADYCKEDKTFRGNYSYEFGTVQLIPDSNIVMLTHPRWKTSDDNMTFTTANGLLTSVHTISDDKSGEFIGKLAAIYKQVAVSRGVAKGAGAPNGLLILKACDSLAREVLSTLSFDVFDANSLDGAESAILGLTKEKITLGVGPKGASGRLDTPVPVTSDAEGIFYRPLTSYPVYISKDATVVGVGYFAVPDQSKLATIAIERQNFTKSETTLTFVNGMLVSEAYVRNNPASGAAQTGLETLQTVASIPHAIIEGLILGTGDNKGVIEAQTRYLTAQKDLLDASTANIKAQKDLSDSDSSRSVDDGPPVN